MLDYLNGQEFNEHNPYGCISKNSFIMDDSISQPLGDWVMKCMKDLDNVMRYKYKK